MKKKFNTFKYKKDEIHIYNEENDLVCIIDKESDYILDRLKYGYININKNTGYSTITGSNAKSVHSVLYWDKYPLRNKNSRKWVIDHINGCKFDNRIVNLQYITQKDNCNKSSIYKESMNENLYKRKEYAKQYQKYYHINRKIEQEFVDLTYDEANLKFNNLFQDLVGDEMFYELNRFDDFYKKY